MGGDNFEKEVPVTEGDGKRESETPTPEPVPAPEVPAAPGEIKKLDGVVVPDKIVPNPALEGDKK